jgi:hypothetical protein
MKRFKYPLAIEGTLQQLEALIPQLEKLGYMWGSGARNDQHEYPYLVTWYNSEIPRSMAYCRVGDRFRVSASNPELVLALAAAVEGDEFHEGELCYWTGYKPRVVTLTERAREGDSWKSNLESHNSLHESNLRKATKEEIIQHFMNNTSNGVSKTLQVSESFVKSAHAAACSDWKDKIEKEFPDLFRVEFEPEKIYAFRNYGIVYKLSMVRFDSELYAFVSMSKSDSWANGSDTAENLLRKTSQGREVKTFTNVKDFANWILNG